MRHADELHERVAGRDACGIGIRIEDIARHHAACGREFSFRSLSRHSSDTMPAREQLGNETRTDVAGASCDEDAADGHRSIMTFTVAVVAAVLPGKGPERAPRRVP
jgi:hypothetical protein